MKTKKKSKKWLGVSLIIILVAVVAIGGNSLKGKAIQYDEMSPETKDLSTYYTFSGNIEAKNRETGIADEMMQIEEIKVTEGQEVAAGDVLMVTTADKEITAETSGEIVKLYIEENAQVMSGMKLFDIVDYKNLQTSVKVDEYDLSAIKTGDTMEVNVQALNKKISGTVNKISKEAMTANGVSFFIATIDLQQDDALRVGMTIEAIKLNQQALGVLTVPMDLILFREDVQPYVLTKDAEGKSIEKDIQVGINDGIDVEVTSGLSATDILLAQKTNANGSFQALRNSNNQGNGTNSGSSGTTTGTSGGAN